MSRFLLLAIFLIVATGLILHFRFEIPWLNWIGKLPGDIIIKKGGLTIYVPLATSIVLSAVLSIFSSIFFKPSK